MEQQATGIREFFSTFADVSYFVELNLISFKAQRVKIALTEAVQFSLLKRSPLLLTRRDNLPRKYSAHCNIFNMEVALGSYFAMCMLSSGTYTVH